jgi:hypothetical protein
LRHKLLLTFDIEDFINLNEIYALHRILEILQKYELTAIFFITGYLAEKLSNFPETVNLLKNHEIGFHSSSHSVRPAIPEYTDIKSYKKAYEISIERETSHINPLTGEPEKEGGIYELQKLFHPKKIEVFRAPGMCWTPPHLEALRDLGIKYDFSSNITTSEPVHYRGITFYPYTFIQKWNGTVYNYECLLQSILKNKISVFDLHPTLLVNKIEWDFIYYKGNPKTLLIAPKRPENETRTLFQKFELLIKQISMLNKAKLIDTKPKFDISSKSFKISKEKVQRCYEKSMQWPRKRFNYNPKFIRNHFFEFFNEICY